MEKLWTTAEAARFLGIAEMDVERLVQQNQLTGYRLGGRFLRFRPEQVQGLKEAVRRELRPNQPVAYRKPFWMGQIREFVYFYDFYVVSATLLAVLIVYLVASG